MCWQLENKPLMEIHCKLKSINIVFLIYNESEHISKKLLLISRNKQHMSWLTLMIAST